MHGISLARRFYLEVVAPLLPHVPHAAALLGDGSEVLGFDDAISTDHNFGPRLQVSVEGHAEAMSVARRLGEGLPERFDGSAVAFPVPGRFGGSIHHQVVVTTPDAFFHDLVRFDPGDGVGRAAGIGDDLGSRVLATRLARDLMRLAFLIGRRWAPYGKWLGGAFDELDLADEVGPHLTETLTAGMWRGREAGLCEAIEDDEVVALLARLGRRDGNEVGWLQGAIDQAVDGTDVLAHPDRCRAAAELLGLPV